MSQDAFKQMTADKALTRDIEKARTPEELRDLLHAALERSGATRDPETGQFVRRDPLTPAAQTAQTDEPKHVTKVEKIGGRDITFTGTELDVEQQITAAYKVAAALAPVPEPQVRVRQQRTQAEIERDISDRAELDLQFRRGELTPQEYLDRTNAIGEWLESRGFDVDAASQAQTNASWAEATQEFLNNTPEGQTWKGGSKNLSIIGTLILAHGWDNATDKVAALRAAAKEMREKNLEFDGDVSPEEVIKMTEGMSPTEILEAFKEGQNGDPEAANKAFIEIHSNGRSGIFDR
jgi:hypothetical protein